jgi:hypothetical protein
MKLAVVLFVGACAIQSVPASADQSGPFKGAAWETIIAVNEVAGGIEVTTEGYGVSTHLGRFYRIAHVLIRADGTVEGLTGWLSASGDLIIMELESTPLSATTFAGTYTIVFGNGRFADAEGSAEFVASTVDGLTYSIRFNGEIDY